MLEEFTAKIENFDKKCGFLKFYYFVLCPIIAFFRIWGIVEMASGAADFYAVPFVLNLLTAVAAVLSAATFITLSKAAFFSGLSLIILCAIGSVYNTLSILGLFNDINTGDDFVDGLLILGSSILYPYIMFFEAVAIGLLIVITIYLVNRYKLFD